MDLKAGYRVFIFSFWASDCLFATFANKPIHGPYTRTVRSLMDEEELFLFKGDKHSLDFVWTSCRRLSQEVRMRRGSDNVWV